MLLSWGRWTGAEEPTGPCGTVFRDSISAVVGFVCQGKGTCRCLDRSQRQDDESGCKRMDLCSDDDIHEVILVDGTFDGDVV